MAMLMRDFKLRGLKKEREDDARPWSADVVDTRDDPWKDGYRETDW
jgi:hypothetical protein